MLEKVIKEERPVFKMQEDDKDMMSEIEDRKKDAENEKSFFADISKTLRSQVHEELGLSLEDENTVKPDEIKKRNKRIKRKRIKKILLISLGIFLLLLLFFVGTKPGRRIGYKLMALYIHGRVESVNPNEETDLSYVPPTEVPLEGDEGDITHTDTLSEARTEDYVMTCLIFGIEEIDGARNTDSMMLASINIKTKKITLVSLLRDTYVQIPGYRGNKLNSVYAKCANRADGANLLIQAIENTYHVNIDAYASVSFDAMEQIVNKLGGITIELGQAEANYLNIHNYISNPAYRNVRAGVNLLNGNQVVGYCRIRKVATLGGANNDYGRTLRQRRVLSAIFEKYKSKGFFDLISIADQCLTMVRTDLTHDQIAKALELFIENGINTMDSARFPMNDMFYDSGETPYNGVTYALVPDIEANTKELFKFIYGDTEEEAEENYERYKNSAADVGLQ